MKKRGERTVRELYDLTAKISKSEVTPLVEGSYIVERPLSELDHEFLMKEASSPSRKSQMSKDSPRIRTESGTCNVCSAPCSSCLHRSRSLMNSRTECRLSENDSCSFISGTSNLLSASSSHDSYSQNAESKATLKSSAMCDASEVVDMPSEEPLGGPVGEDQHLFQNKSSNSCSSHGHSNSDSHLGRNLKQQEDHCNVECHGDNMSCSMDRVQSSCGGHPTSNTIEGTKSGVVLKCEGSDTNNIRSESPPRDLMNCTSLLRTEAGVNSKIQLCEGVESGNSNKKHENQNAAADDQGPQMQALAITENENTDTDGLLDVKVCDICGDAGREELLATCSRCSDGAEHTYCMRVMLDKVPEGDWLCEECQCKDSEKTKFDSQSTSVTPRAECLKENSQTTGSTFNFKKLDIREIDHEIGKGLPRKADKWQVDDVDVPCMTGKRIFEKSGGSLEKGSPRKNNVLSRESSFKNADTKIVKPTNNAVTSPPTLSRQYSLGNISKVQTQLNSPRGFLSKQASFNNLNMKPKVKQLTESAHHKQYMARKLTKSESSKSLDLGRTKYDPASQKQFPNSPRAEQPRNPKPIKEKNVPERKSSFILDRPTICPSPKFDSSNKVDPKIAKHEGKLNKKSESNMFNSNKGTDDAENLARVEVKKQKTQISESHGRSYTDEQKPCKVIPKEGGCAISNANNKDKENSSKISKWKIAAKTAVSMTRTPNKKNSTVKTSDCSTLRVDASCDIASKDILSTVNFRENSSLKVTSDQKDVFRSSAGDLCEAGSTINVQPARQLAESLNLPNSDELDRKSSAQAYYDQSSLLGNPFRAHVIPEHEFIWQGSFEVLRSGGFAETFDGIQAHLSSCVSPKVLAAVKQFPCRVQLQEVPRVSSWPSQFQETRPNEFNIALFFFAKDIESYENTYQKLLANMLKDDFALKGNISGVELLIFPSNKLTENCQRWNRLLFLWGVFQAMRLESSKELPDSPAKASEPKFSNPTSQDLRQQLDFSTKKKNSHENLEKKFLGIEKSSKLKEEKSTMDFQHFVSSRSVDTEVLTSPPQLSVSQAGPENKLSEPASSKSLCQLPNSLPPLGSELYTSVEVHNSSAKRYYINLNSVNNLEEDGHAAVSPVYIEAGSSQSKPSGISAASDIRQGTVGRESVGIIIEGIITGKGRSIKHEASSDSELQDQLKATDLLNSEFKLSNKRPRSSSMEITSHPSVKTPKSTNEIISWNSKVHFISPVDEPEFKKTKYYGEGHANNSPRNINTSNSLSSSKLRPSLPLDINEPPADDLCTESVLADNSQRAAEKRFLAVDSFPIKNPNLENVINVLSSDDEGPPGLELALGKSKLSKKEALPLFSSLINSKGVQNELLPSSSVNNEDDLSASLSLSLSFPPVANEKADSFPSTKQFLPERPGIEPFFPSVR